MNNKYNNYILSALLCLLFNCYSNTTRAQIPPYIPSGGLLAWYPFNGTLNDETLLGSNGVGYGSVQYATDRFGVPNACYNVNWASLATIPVNNFPLGNHARSVTTFFKYKLPYAGGGRPFIGWGYNIFGQSFALYASDTLLGVAYVNGAVTTHFIPDTAWHNLTVTYPSTGGGSAAIKLYVDGAITVTNTINPIAAYNTVGGPGSWPGMAGSQYYLPLFTDSWTGKMDDAAIWDREITPCEVYQIYKGTINFTPVISGSNSVCVPGSNTLSTTIAGGTWSSSAPLIATVNTTGVVTGLAAGNAIITYSLTNVCGTFSDTMMTMVGGLTTVGPIAGPTNICIGTPVTLTNTAAWGTWSSTNPSVATINSSTGLLTGLTVGTTLISYTLTNSCGSATDTQTVVVNALPSVGSIAGTSSFCAGTSVTLTNPTTGGIWSSSNPAVASVSSGTGVVAGLSAGNAVITYSFTNFCGTATDTQAVVVFALPFAGSITGPSSLCAGTTISLIDAAPGGTWTSSTPSIATVGSSSGIVSGVTAGTTLITYSATNICGTATDTQTIVVHPLPNPGTITGSPGLCIGTSASLTNTVTGGTWSSTGTGIATINSTTGIVYALATGTTTIIYTPALNSFGCGNSTSFVLTVNSLTTSNTITNIKCNGDSNGGISITVNNGSGSYQYLWSNGSTSSSVSGLTSGTYTIIVKDLVTSCADTQSFTLSMPAVLDIESKILNDLCSLGKGKIDLVNILGGTSPYTSLWSTGATTTSITGLVSGDYSVNITDNNLCTKSFTLTVGEDSCNEVLVHDAITPNGDGKNDVWVLEGINKYHDNTVQVFDKWGDIVFDSHSYNNTWGGEGKNGLLPDGTYFYLIKLNTTNLPVDKNELVGSLLIKR